MTVKSYTSQNLLNLAKNVIFEQSNDHVNGIDATTNDITGKKENARNIYHFILNLLKRE